MRKFSWLLQTVVLLLAACNTTPEVDPQGSPSTITLPDGTTIKTCNTVEWALNAGGSPTRNTGTVTVSNDHTNLYLQVYSKYGFQDIATNLKVVVATDLELVPHDLSAFKWKASVAPGDTTHTFIIPLADIECYGNNATCSSSYYILIHADVFVDEYGTVDYASGGTTCGRPTNCGCYCYGLYTGRCCADDTPPTNGRTETAFAKGGYVFTTDDKSNPEDLPTLGLSKNRWGWAINIKEPGESTYSIYAGAGLNDISKGELVGTLTVNWTGTSATVKYETSAGFWLGETHIYAGDGKPTTIAPGLFGHTQTFNPKVHTYSETIAVADTNGDGIWIVAHAGVYGAF